MEGAVGHGGDGVATPPPAGQHGTPSTQAVGQPPNTPSSRAAGPSTPSVV